jgi:hypothetical protein
MRHRNDIGAYRSESSDAHAMLKRFLNQPLQGITIDKETVTISFANGFIEFSGDDFELYVELLPQPN